MAATTVSSGVLGSSSLTFNKINANTAHTDSNQSFSVAQRGTISDLGVKAAGTLTLDMNTANHFKVVVNGNITIANPSNITAGQGGSIVLTANGSYTTSFGSQWRFAEGSAPTLSTSSGKQDRLDYYVASSNTIHTIATIDLLGTA